MLDTFQLQELDGVRVVTLLSEDGTNRLTRARILALTNLVSGLSATARPIVITGNTKFFSAGADLREIAELNGPEAYEFSKMGQCLMNCIEQFPAAVCAAVNGYCMVGGLDLALACHRRIASTHAIFGHRGAALGLITGWGGTQRLPRIVGKSRTLEILVTAEKIHAKNALRWGLVDTIDEDPANAAVQWLNERYPM